MILSQPSFLARSVRSSIRLALTRSSASLPGLSWVAPIGLPPRMREMMIGRAVSPEPAIAPSPQWLPVASKAFANSITAADSPPDVHQCVTSRSVALAAVPSIRAAARQATTVNFFIVSPPNVDWKRIPPTPAASPAVAFKRSLPTDGVNSISQNLPLGQCNRLHEFQTLVAYLSRSN